jgi:hypothetical protein
MALFVPRSHPLRTLRNRTAPNNDLKNKGKSIIPTKDTQLYYYTVHGLSQRPGSLPLLHDTRARALCRLPGRAAS